jgi:TetR/AcrR family transcriptional repressor of mexJK operon
VPGKPLIERINQNETNYVPKIGRPSVQQAQAIAEHILQSAQRLFLSEGYALTTMEAIATAAGISKGTLYVRFPSKKELFRGLVADRLKAWEGRTPAWVEQPNISIFDYLYRRGSLILAAFQDEEVQAFTHLLNSEARHFPELADEFRTNSYDRVISDITDEIERQSKEGGWPTTDARGVAVIFVSALTGWWSRNGYLNFPKEDGELYLARLIALLTSGRAAF